MKKSYEVSLTDSNYGKINWVFNGRKLLDDFGFSYVFGNSDTIDIKIFPKLFKRRFIDCFIQEWFSSIGSSPVLEEYN